MSQQMMMMQQQQPHQRQQQVMQQQQPQQPQQQQGYPQQQLWQPAEGYPPRGPMVMQGQPGGVMIQQPGGVGMGGGATYARWDDDARPDATSSREAAGSSRGHAQPRGDEGVR